MIGELIKEYLVGLGVQIDKPGFKEFESTINKTDAAVAKTTSGWVRNFTQASAILATALGSITASAAGVMTAAAKQDLAMEKYARNMLLAKDAAWQMRSALDALGESVQDIQLTPELMGRYKSLLADGRRMQVGGDYNAAMHEMRDLLFEFTRLKQESSYALKWVGYYLAKYLSRPLSEAKARLKSLNDSLIQNMPAQTAKIARAILYIVNVGRHFWDLLKAIGKTAHGLWDAFPAGVKKAAAALAGFFLLLKLSPLYRMAALISTLLLLVDDYFSYMEGKQAALGPVWDKLNGYIDASKKVLQSWGDTIAPLLQDAIGWLSEAKDSAGGFAGAVRDGFNVFAKSRECRDSVAAIQDFAGALYDLGGGILSFVKDLIKDFLLAFDQQDALRSFTDLVKGLWDVFNSLIDRIADLTRTIGRWLREIGRSEVVRDLIDAVVELFVAVSDLIGVFFDLSHGALQDMYVTMGNRRPMDIFKDALKAIISLISDMIRLVAATVRGLKNLFKLMQSNRILKEFWRGLSKSAEFFLNVVLRAVRAVGTLGRALIALVRRDYKQAWSLASKAVKNLFSDDDTKSTMRGGFKGTGDRERDGWIRDAAKEFNVPPALIAAVMKTESSFIPNAGSYAGARGYMQLMPETAKELGVDIDDPRDNIRGGTKYLRQLMDRFGDDLTKVIAAYNAGPEAVKEYKGVPPYKETQEYVQKVLEAIPEYAASFEPGQGEGTTWHRVESENPKYEYLQDKAKIGTEEVAQIHFDLTGKPLGMTSAMRNKELGYSDEQIGGHGTGLKVDFVSEVLEKNPELMEEFIRRCEEIGIKVINEYKIKFGHTTGGHLDIDFKNYETPSTMDDWQSKQQLPSEEKTLEENPPETSVPPQEPPPEEPPPKSPPPKEEEHGFIAGIKKLGDGIKGLFEKIGESATGWTGGETPIKPVSFVQQEPIALDYGQNRSGIVEAHEGEGVQTLIAYLKSALTQTDPRLLKELRENLREPAPAYMQSGGQSVVIQNTVRVGDIYVSKTNASPKEIGSAIADETMRRMGERANYMLKNRALSSGVMV